MQRNGEAYTTIIYRLTCLCTNKEFRSVMESSLRRYTELPYLIDYLQSKELVLLSPKSWDDRNDSYYIERFALASGLLSTYALCLAEAPETYHHWRVFSHGGGGVCIEFDKAEIVRAASLIPGMRAENVTYKTISELGRSKPSTLDLPFLKRHAFADEKEFRLFHSSVEEGPPVFRLSVPLRAVKRITLSPWLPSSVVIHIVNTLRSIEGCTALKIFQSTLVENEDWKILASFSAN
ncbi:hypothetical protein ABH908_004633 [Pseudomonas frederiksbergensis]|nr:hypothetical protein SRABI130_01800 [Pseudomonas sp. Bi130]